MTHYETLGVNRDATADEIKKAYRRKASKAHSDRGGGSDEQMAKINVAYEVLSDPERRQNYDVSGKDTVDDLEKAAYDLIVSKAAMFIQNDASENQDLIASIRQSFLNDLQMVVGNKTKGIRLIARLDRTLSNLVYKGDGTDKIGDMIRHQKEHVSRQLLAVENDTAKINLALKLLESYEYKITGFRHPMQPFMAGAFMTTRTFP